MLIWARIVGGLGVGMASVLAPMFISEFSPPRIRGRLVALYQLSIVIGILAAYFSNWLLLRFAQSNPAASAAAAGCTGSLVAEVWRGMFGAGHDPRGRVLRAPVLRAGKPPLAGRRPAEERRGLAILARISGQETAQRELAEIQQAPGAGTGVARRSCSSRGCAWP